MPGTIEGIVECLARVSPARCDQELVDCARSIGALVRSSVPASLLDPLSEAYDAELDEFLEEFEGMSLGSAGDDPDYTLLRHFDGWLDTLYDIADRHRIWLGG
jgi:hypothetical protein